MKKARAAVLVFACAATARASDFSSSAAGTTAADFLNLGVSARAAGMGNAYSAEADDASAVFWNPAALTRIDSRSITLMHDAYIASSFFDYAAYGQKVGASSAVGADVKYFSAGAINGTDINNASTGNFDPYDLAASLACATRVPAGPLEGFSFGLAGKFIQSRVVTSARTEAADLGLLSPAWLEERLRLALAAQNLGGTLKYEQYNENLPMSVRMGAAYRITPRWLMTLDLAAPRSENPYAALGTEFEMARSGPWSALARAGYSSQSMQSITGVTGLSLGFGVGYAGASFDYAFVPYGGLGLTNRVSLSYRWGGSGGLAADEPEPRPAPLITAMPAPPPEPKDSGPDLQRIAELIRQKRLSEADRELSRLSALLSPKDPLRVAVYERSGIVAYMRNDVGRARGDFKSSIDLASDLGVKDDHVAQAYVGLGLCFAREKDEVLAVQAFRKALTSDPSDQTRRLAQQQLDKIDAAGLR